MNELKQALRQAVRALTEVTCYDWSQKPASVEGNDNAAAMCDAAIAAAEAAMAQPEPEPVARIRCWTKAGEGHAELEDWEFPGIEQLPDGVHLLYARTTTQSVAT